MTTLTRTQYFIAENGHNEEALFTGTGPDDDRCQEVVTRRELERLSPDLWAAVTQLAVLPEVAPDAKPRTEVGRDRFNGQVRAVFRDPHDLGLIYSHWLTDNDARALAAQLLATVNA